MNDHLFHFSTDLSRVLWISNLIMGFMKPWCFFQPRLGRYRDRVPDWQGRTQGRTQGPQGSCSTDGAILHWLNAWEFHNSVPAQLRLFLGWVVYWCLSDQSVYLRKKEPFIETDPWSHLLRSHDLEARVVACAARVTGSSTSLPKLFFISWSIMCKEKIENPPILNCSMSANSQGEKKINLSWGDNRLEMWAV